MKYLFLPVTVLGALLLPGCVSFDPAEARQDQTSQFSHTLEMRAQDFLTRPLTLDDCLRIAMTNNYDIRLAELDKLIGSFDTQLAFSAFLPQVSASNVVDMEKFIVTIVPPQHHGGSCLLYFNEQPVTTELLKQRLGELRGRARSASVIIRADRAVPFETVTEVMSLAAAARLASFIAVAPPSEKPETVFGQ